MIFHHQTNEYPEFPLQVSICTMDFELWIMNFKHYILEVKVLSILFWPRYSSVDLFGYVPIVGIFRCSFLWCRIFVLEISLRCNNILNIPGSIPSVQSLSFYDLIKFPARSWSFVMDVLTFVFNSKYELVETKLSWKTLETDLQMNDEINLSFFLLCE